MLALLLALTAMANDDEAVQVSMRALDAGIVEIGQGGQVQAVQADGPAWVAGVRPGQRLLRIDGLRVSRMGPLEIMARLSGPEGTQVVLSVEQDGEPADLTVSIRPYDPHNGSLMLQDGSVDLRLICDKGDCEDGSGKAVDEDGYVLAGTFIQGSPSGYAIERAPSGERYDGGFEAGLRHGPGALTLPGGDRYAGVWIDGVADGPFTVRYDKDGTYEGGVRGLLPHGEGVRIWPDGRRYEGGFEFGEFDGSGDLVLPSGEHYSGAFQNNLAHGQGALDLPRGDHLEGAFFKGRLQGQGLRRWADDGREYQGSFQANEPHGQGELRWADEEVHRGTFVEGEIQGPGVRTLPGGRVIAADWIDERRALGRILHDDGTVLYEGWIVAGKAEGWGRRFKKGEWERPKMYFNDKPRGEHPRSPAQGREEREAYDAFDWSAVDALLQASTPDPPGAADPAPE